MDFLSLYFLNRSSTPGATTWYSIKLIKHNYFENDHYELCEATIYGLLQTCSIKNSPLTCMRTNSVMNLLLTVTVLALVDINICTGDDGLPSYAVREFHVDFLRQFSTASPLEMVVFTKSSTPVQFNISSSIGFNHTGTTTDNAACYLCYHTIKFTSMRLHLCFLSTWTSRDILPKSTYHSCSSRTYIYHTCYDIFSSAMS